MQLVRAELPFIADCGLSNCRLNGLPVISEEEALERILSKVLFLPPTEVFLADALDRFAAADLFATIPLPPFDNSGMVGYALVRASAPGHRRPHMVGEHPAGAPKHLSL